MGELEAVAVLLFLTSEGPALHPRWVGKPGFAPPVASRLNLQTGARLGMTLPANAFYRQIQMKQW